LGARIEYKQSVEKDLRDLPRRAAIRILARIERQLIERGREGEPLKGQLAGLFRLRAGDYRVIYSRTEEGYLVLRIRHRRDDYR
jgi:mRNA interferase RelE/StbE